MADYETGYAKPPKHTQFKPGQSGNPNGRPKSSPDALGELALGVMESREQWRENGQTKTGTSQEVSIKLQVEKAVRGDIGAAELTLKKRNRALRHGQKAAQQLIVSDWLPDHPDTGERVDLSGAATDPSQNRIADDTPSEDKTS